MLGENMAQPLARPLRPRGDDDGLALRRQRLDMIGGGLKHIDFRLIALGGETRPARAPKSRLAASPWGAKGENRTCACASSRARHSSCVR